MRDKKYGEWKKIELCKCCGHIVNYYQIFETQTCPNCATVGTYLLPTVTTSARKVYTFMPTRLQKLMGKKPEYELEWSGKICKHDDKHVDLTQKALSIHGGVIRATPTTIAASGVASGLF